MITVDYLKQQRSGQAPVHLISLLSQKVLPRPLPTISGEVITKPVHIVLDRRADIALKTLLPEDRENVSNSIHRLKLALTSVLRSNQVVKVEGRENLFIMKISDLRILFELTSDQLTIQDIYFKNRIENIFS